MVSTALLMVASMVAGQAGQAEQAALTVPQDVMRELQSFVGTWKAQVKPGDKQVNIEYTFKIADNGVSLYYTIRSTEPAEVKKASGIAGWDGVKGELVIAEFSEDGSHALIHLQRKIPGKLWEGIIESSDAKSMVTGRGKWTLEMPAADKVISRRWKTATPKDGEAPEAEMTTERIK
jgi:hypothetical protein